MDHVDDVDVERELGECMDCAGLNDLSFLFWNIGGLTGKFEEGDFTKYVSKYDIVCFVETFQREKI